MGMFAQKLDAKVKEYEVERHAVFFTDADSKRIYKENVKYTIMRKNTVNGRVYKDDPTIFAWGLLNEPRCETWQVGQLPCSPSRSMCMLYALTWQFMLTCHSHLTSLEGSRAMMRLACGDHVEAGIIALQEGYGCSCI